jgi:hypothetical protein
MITIIVTECTPGPRKWAGLFEARLASHERARDGRLLCVSRQPFLDGCRVLIEEGLDPDTVMTMRHAGRTRIACVRPWWSVPG